MPKFRILSCTRAGRIMTQIFSNVFPICFQYFQYFFNIFQYFSIFCNIFSISFQYCQILQLFNVFSISFQYFSIFFKHATCRQILPNIGIWPKKMVVSPNSAVFGQITEKTGHTVFQVYKYNDIYIYIYMYINTNIYIRCVYIYIYCLNIYIEY